MLFVKKFVHMWMCRHELWKWALEHEVFLTCMWPVHIVLSVRWSFYISMGLLTEEFYFLKYTVVLLVYNIYIYILRYIYIYKMRRIYNIHKLSGCFTRISCYLCVLLLTSFLGETAKCQGTVCILPSDSVCCNCSFLYTLFCSLQLIFFFRSCIIPVYC